MGLIRKSLAVGTVGLVRPSSKKQRVARQTMRNTAAATKALQEQAALTTAASKREADELRFRYDTDPVYRAWADEQSAARAVKAEARAHARAAEQADRAHTRRRRARAVFVLPVQYVVVVPLAVLLLALSFSWALVPPVRRPAWLPRFRLRLQSAFSPWLGPPN